MSHNLTLSKPKILNGMSKDIEFELYQTPTELTRKVTPFLNDRWRVFDEYRQWLININKDEKFNRKEVDSRIEEHLNLIREALKQGYSWSWI
jgi:hypothetical protein